MIDQILIGNRVGSVQGERVTDVDPIGSSDSSL